MHRYTNCRYINNSNSLINFWYCLLKIKFLPNVICSLDKIQISLIFLIPSINYFPLIIFYLIHFITYIVISIQDNFNNFLKFIFNFLVSIFHLKIVIIIGSYYYSLSIHSYSLFFINTIRFIIMFPVNFVETVCTYHNLICSVVLFPKIILSLLIILIIILVRDNFSNFWDLPTLIINV